MELVYQVIGWASIPVMLASVIHSMRTWRREQQLTARSLWIPILVSAISLWLYMRSIGVDPSPAIIWLPFVAAFALGWYLGHTTHVDVRGQAIVASRSAWSYLAWAAAFAATQLVALLAPESTETVLAVFFAATGLTIGQHAALVVARSNQRSRLRTIAAGAGIVLAVLAIGAALVPRTGYAADVAADLGDVAGMRLENGADVNPSINGVTATINGTGTTYSGPSISVTITNTTADTMRIRVPVGTRLFPANAGVQTMLAAGDETIVVPPGQTVTETIQAYCGEATDSAPGTEDTFTVGEPVTGATLETLREIARRRDEITDPEQGLTFFDAQRTVWMHTDAETHQPATEDDPAYELYRPDGSGPTTEESGRAGGAAAAVSAAGAALGTRPSRRNGSADGNGGAAPGDDSGAGDDGSGVATAETPGDSTGETSSDSTGETSNGSEPERPSAPATVVPIGPVTYDLDTGSAGVQTGGASIGFDRPERKWTYSDSGVSISYDLDDKVGRLRTADGSVTVETAPGSARIDVKGTDRNTTVTATRSGDTKTVDYLQTGGRYDQRYVLTLNDAGGKLTHTSGARTDTFTFSGGASFQHTGPGLTYGAGTGPDGSYGFYETDVRRGNTTLTPGLSFSDGEWHPSLAIRRQIPIRNTPWALEPSIKAIGGPGSSIRPSIGVTRRF